MLLVALGGARKGCELLSIQDQLSKLALAHPNDDDPSLHGLFLVRALHPNAVRVPSGWGKPNGNVTKEEGSYQNKQGGAFADAHAPHAAP